jgi:hypothetical protein
MDAVQKPSDSECFTRRENPLERRTCLASQHLPQNRLYIFRLFSFIDEHFSLTELGDNGACDSLLTFVVERGIIHERSTAHKNYYCRLSFPSGTSLLELDEIPETDISFLLFL